MMNCDVKNGMKKFCLNYKYFIIDLKNKFMQQNFIVQYYKQSFNIINESVTHLESEISCVIDHINLFDFILILSLLNI